MDKTLGGSSTKKVLKFCECIIVICLDLSSWWGCRRQQWGKEFNTRKGKCLDKFIYANLWLSTFRFFTTSCVKTNVPGGTSHKEPACQFRRQERHRFSSWVGKIPWRRAWQPIPVFLPGESYGQRSLAGYSPGGHKSWTWLKQLSMPACTVSGSHNRPFLECSEKTMCHWHCGADPSTNYVVSAHTVLLHHWAGAVCLITNLKS